MERYIGMDVHAASCTLAVISEKGRKLRDFPVETNGQALVEAVRMIPGHKHLVFEEGLQSAWIYETLRPHVDELVVAGITRSRGPKSDKRDAYGLAEKLRVGNLDKPVFKAPRQFTRLRELSRIHMTLVGDAVRVQSRIKSLYRSRGILVSGVNVYGIRHREEWKQQLCSSAQMRATRLYDHLDFLLEQKKQAEGDLLREAKKHSIVRVLETAPGFGPIRAARLVPIVVTPHRFRTKRQFWSYCGLGVVTRSSSDWIQAADGGWIKARVPQTRGLSRQHNRVLKSLFKGAATTVITQVNKDPIHARYERLCDGGTKPTLAKLSLARMIAATVLRMWKNEEEYDPGRVGPSTKAREG
jgi:transposase